MRNLYETLHVRRDAQDHAIKAAYRKLSKKFHPDMPTGNAEMFREIETAFRVLSDPQMRTYYDKHGDVPPAGPEVNPNAQLYTLLQQAAMAALADISDVATLDFIARMKQKILDHKAQIGNEQAPVRAAVKKHKAARERITRKDGENLLATLMQSQIDGMENKLSEGDRLVLLDDEAIKFLSDYQYEFKAYDFAFEPRMVYTHNF